MCVLGVYPKTRSAVVHGIIKTLVPNLLPSAALRLTQPIYSDIYLLCPHQQLLPHSRNVTYVLPNTSFCNRRGPDKIDQLFPSTATLSKQVSLVRHVGSHFWNKSVQQKKLFRSLSPSVSLISSWIRQRDSKGP